MSDQVINDSIEFISNPYGRRIIGFKAKILESNNGIQQVFNHTTHDRREYTINLLQYTRAERDTFLEFYLERAGTQDTFLFKDEAEYIVPRNSIGTGDGVDDTWQLIEVKGTTSFNRYEIIASSYTGWVNSVLQVEGGGNDYTLDATDSGIVTFNGGSIPAMGHDIEFAFSYYRRCRFITQLTDLETSVENVQLANIRFAEVKPSGV